MKRIARSFSIAEYELPMRIVSDGNYYSATCPVWKDCYAMGKTIDEATAEMIAVASALIDLYREEGKIVPLKRRSGSRENTGGVAFSVPVFSTA